MNILHVGDFDCAGVAWHHKVATERYLGYAVKTAMAEKTGIASKMDVLAAVDSEQVRELGNDWADVVLLHAGLYVGQPELLNGKRDILERAAWVSQVRDKLVLWLNGSRAIRSHADYFRKAYSGYRMVATNPDVALSMGCDWIPCCILDEWDRGVVQHDPSMAQRWTVCQLPTDRLLKNTEELERATHNTGWRAQISRALSHEETLSFRNDAHACFDHMNGYFGVTSLESAALGMPNIVYLDEVARAYIDVWCGKHPPWYTEAYDCESLRALLTEMANEGAEAISECGRRSRSWYEWHMRNEIKARRLVALLESL
jgi:hypothetical protein